MLQQTSDHPQNIQKTCLNTNDCAFWRDLINSPNDQSFSYVQSKTVDHDAASQQVSSTSVNGDKPLNKNFDDGIWFT